MKKILTNWRYYVLVAVGAVCWAGMCCEVAETHPHPVLAFVAAKAVGLAAGVALCVLQARWVKAGELPELEELLREED